MAKKLIGSKSIKAYSEPLFQKPKSLGLDSPGFHYWGRNPDDGTSYGAYVCEHDGLGIIASQNEELFCVACSRPMKNIGSFAKRRDGSVNTKTMAKLNRTKMYNLPKCTSCKKGVMTSANWISGGSNETFCIYCGEDLTASITKIKKASKGNIKAKSNELVQSILNTPDSFENINVEDINMSLYASADNAYWNIDIKGKPVAQITLSKLDKSEEIKDFFFDEKGYSKAIISSIVQMGLVETLQATNATIWASQTDVSDIYKTARTEAHASIKESNKGFKEEFLSNIALVCAGMDKNFYSMKNPLKGSFYSNMANYNIADANIIEIIESSFKEGAVDYFEVILNKASEYMNLSAQAKNEITKAIGESGLLDPHKKIQANVTAGSKLEANSIDLSNVGNSVGYNYEEEKQQYKKLFNF